MKVSIEFVKDWLMVAAGIIVLVAIMFVFVHYVMLLFGCSG